MALGKKGLGRGFESLIPTDIIAEEFDVTKNDDAKVSQLTELKLDQIIRDESQPRKNFDKEALQELADSIKEHGVLQPIVVTKEGNKYQIVAGERRWRASKLAGLETIPVIIRTIDDQHRLEMMIIENAQREDLTPIELATAYAKLKEQFNLSNSEISQRVGKSPSSVVNTMRLLKLPDDVKQAMQEHRLMEGPMRPLVNAQPELVREVLPKIVDEGWSARKVEQYITDKKQKSSHAAVKVNEFLKEERVLGEIYGCAVRIRGRSVTLSSNTDEEFKILLKTLEKSEK